MLSHLIDEKLLDLLWGLNTKITHLYGILHVLPVDELDEIHRYARISQIGASTRIENAILTDAEISWMDTILEEDGKRTAYESQKDMIQDKFSKDHERSIEEVAGCRGMLLLIYEQIRDFFPLTEVTMRGLHQELLRYYPATEKYAGSYKTKSNAVIAQTPTGKKRVVFQPAEPGLATKSAMAELVDWYNETMRKETWTLAIASEFVFRFLAIHPFQDGNGRLGRALFLMSMLQSPNIAWSFVFRFLAIDRQIEKNKEEYYFVLNRCSHGKYLSNPKKYHLEYFLRFMLKMVDASLTDVEIYREKFANMKHFSTSEEKIFRCFQEKPELRLQPKNIIKETGLPRRTISLILSKLEKKKFIQKKGKGPSVRYQLVF